MRGQDLNGWSRETLVRLMPSTAVTLGRIETQASRLATSRPVPGRRAVGPLLLYLLIALGIMFPYRGSAVRSAGDIPVALSLVLQADHALREGQFPIRIGPECMNGLRYPIFQFYGNFPYTVTGALSVLFHNPYFAWKIVNLAALVFGGYFMMRLSQWLSGSSRAAVLSGVVFLCAPYLLTDLNARGAFAEMVAFCLMPVAFYATFRCLGSTSLRRILWCGVAWTLIGLTHNISYLYGVLFAGLFCLPFLLSPHGGPRLLRLIVAGLVHAALMLWYVVPQFQVLKLLIVNAGVFNPFIYADVAPLNILLAPVQTNNLAGSGTPHLGLQVGWPILAGVILAAIALVLRRRSHAPRRLIIGLLSGGFVLSFLIAWSPFDFWKHLPTTLWFVQFPYRLLLFVVLFGSGLFACGLERLFPRRVPTWATVLVLGVAGVAFSSYIPRGRAQGIGTVADLYEHPQVNELTGYLTMPTVMIPRNVSDADPVNVDWEARMAQLASKQAKGPIPRIGIPMLHVMHGRRNHIDYLADRRTWLEFPVLDYPGLMDVRDNDRKTTYHDSGRFITLQLGRGLHKIVIAFVGAKWANIVSMIAWIVVGSLLVVPVIQPVVHRIRVPVAVLVSSAAKAAFAPREAVAAFMLLLACALIPLYPPLRLWWLGRPSLHFSSSPSSSDSGPENAFDDDLNTAWIAEGSAPAWLNVQFSRAATIHGLLLDSRVTSLNECWQHLGLTLFKDGGQVYSASFDFPAAASDGLESVSFPARSVDRIEMRFSDPVLNRSNGGHVTADQVNPGYREIQILWGS